MNDRSPNSTALQADAPLSALDGVVRLSHLGVIRAQGIDAASFLQGQLSQDFVLLKPDQARLAAYCSAKGRMLASFVGFQHSADGFLLVCSADLLATTLKRLGMFVLRAKVQLSDASADFQIWGCIGSAVHALAGNNLGVLAKRELESATMVGLHPAAGQVRALWLAPAEAPAPLGSPLAPGLWAWGEVQSGVATLSAPLVDAFVPQMLNFESVGGVNFKKGCYPGQEVVARIQFRGVIKRRAFIVHANAPLLPTQEIFHDGEPEQACGQVVQVASAQDGACVAIAVLQVTATESGNLSTSGGTLVSLMPLPYPLLEDI